MNRLWTLVLLGLIALGNSHVLAQRVGEGTSMGTPSGKVAQAAPSSGAVSQTSAGSSAAAAGAQRPWLGALGGVAAGLGLAWVASSLGLGEGFAQVLLALLAAIVVWVGFRLTFRRLTPAAPAQNAFASAGGGDSIPLARGYSPKNVGNDASARPWESQPGSDRGNAAISVSTPWGVPDDFDTIGFLNASKANFVSLQDAWDRSDIPSLRAMMTDGMLAEIRTQLIERERSGAGDNKTEVVMLEARLLGIETLESDYMASVEFSGLIREDVSAGPNPFREVWNITRPKSNASGWLVAGVQALQ